MQDLGFDSQAEFVEWTATASDEEIAAIIAQLLEL
jgi:hypothetical protein